MKNLLVGVLIILGLQVAPEFEVQLWPGEGIPHLFPRIPELELRESPSAGSPVVVRVPAVSGQEIPYDSTKVLTLSAGLIVARDSARIDGGNWGNASVVSRDDYYGTWHQYLSEPVEPGDTLHYLQTRAEAECFVRVNGLVISASPCPIYREELFELVAAPDVEWWVRVIQDGVPPGWLLVADSVVEVRRSF